MDRLITVCPLPHFPIMATRSAVLHLLVQADHVRIYINKFKNVHVLSKKAQKSVAVTPAPNEMRSALNALRSHLSIYNFLLLALWGKKTAFSELSKFPRGYGITACKKK